jgi:hypothetical protein
MLTFGEPFRLGSSLMADTVEVPGRTRLIPQG